MKQNKTEIILEVATKHILDLEAKILKRCLLEGCCYGYEHEDKEPREQCIYCGADRKMIDDDFFNDSLRKKIKNLQKHINRLGKK